MFKFAAPALAALGLVALAAQSQADSRSAGTEPMSWQISHEGATAKLAYGLPNSDQLALMIMCEPGQREAVVYGDVLPASPRLTQASMEGEIDPLSGGLAQESRLALNDPVFQRLATEGRLRVRSEDGRTELKANREERRVVAGFMSYCGGRSA